MFEQFISRRVGEDLVVTSKDSNRIFVLNPPAGFAWQCLEDGVPLPQIPAKIGEHFGIDEEIAATDFKSLLNQWEREGIMLPDAARKTYRFADVVVTVYYSSDVALELVPPVLAHAEVEPSQEIIGMPRLVVDIRSDGDQFILLSNGIEIGQASTADELLQLTIASLVNLAHDRADALLTLHAGAIGDRDGCVVMPGKSGSGKSTLMAALVNEGCRYFSDDTVMLDEDFRAIPLPSPLVLKGKKWPALSNKLPAIDLLPVYNRLDQKVRYWSPPGGHVARTHTKVNAIIFPTFCDGSPLKFEELSAAQSLHRIIAANCMVRKAITDELLERLVDWLEAIPSFALTHSSVEEAMSFVKARLAS